MHRSRRIFCALSAVALISACSPDSSLENESATQTLLPLPSESTDVLRAKLDAAGLPTEYAARFDADRVQRITEHRKQGDTTVAAEYAFVGARLVEYRGPNLQAPEQLELQFDMQGAVVSGRSPNVSDEDIAAIRDRAQLLRSHAVAQRAAQMHAAH